MVQVMVPPQDEAIGSALAELDAKLSVWLAAMTAAQEALGQRATLDVKVETPADAADSGLTQAAVEPIAAVAREGCLEPFSDDQSEPESVIEIEEEASNEPLSVDSTATQSERVTSEPQAESSTDAAARPANVEWVSQEAARVAVEQKATDAKLSAAEDDEALLATLDEKVVKVLKVMRRLSPVRKSMRELLADYEAEQADKQDSSQPARTSWWRRKST